MSYLSNFKLVFENGKCDKNRTSQEAKFSEPRYIILQHGIKGQDVVRAKVAPLRQFWAGPAHSEDRQRVSSMVTHIPDRCCSRPDPQLALNHLSCSILVLKSSKFFPSQPRESGSDL